MAIVEMESVAWGRITSKELERKSEEELDCFFAGYSFALIQIWGVPIA